MITIIKKGYSKLEKVFLMVFITIFIFSSTGLLHAFWVENTNMVPAQGGEYLEGALGNIDQNFKINPLFTFGAKANSVEADLSQLVFAGLMRYNPVTGEQEDFLADHTLSEDKKTYTFTLKENLKWHDGYAITADDVMFTFQDVIQSPDFENEYLKNAFAGVNIKKIDDRTVSFTLAEPYKFFLTNFTVGLVPRHALVHTPVKNLSLDSFNQEPIGAGPYKFANISYADPRFDEVRLAKFEEFVLKEPNIDFITIRLYHKKGDLMADTNQLDGIRPMLKTESDFIPDSSKFQEITFHLPHYIAVFINMDNEMFQGENGKKMRWALQLATNKEAILEQVPGERVDTPLLEIDNESWLSEYDAQKAAGALKDSGWIIPGKTEEETNAEENTDTNEETTTEEAQPAEENTETTTDTSAENNNEIMGKVVETVQNDAVPKAKYIYEPSDKVYLETTSKDFFIVGNIPENTARVTINDYTLQLFNSENKRFSFRANTDVGTLKLGNNDYEVKFYDASGNLIDTDKIQIKLTENTADLHGVPEEAATETTNSEEDTAETAEASTEVAPAETEVAPTENTTAENTETPAVEETTTPVSEPVIIDAPQGDDLPPVRVKQTEEEQLSEEKLTLKITTVDTDYLVKTAEILQQQWRQVGIEAQVEVLAPADLLQKIKDRDYELLLYGQNLGYNLDAFPYWHLSQIKVGSNLSEYQNFEASVLLAEIRRTHDEDKRQKDLAKLQEIMKDDVPAVFLYSPDYIMYIDSRIKNIEIENLALFPDRFANVEDWYIKTKRDFPEDKSWFSFFPWFVSKIF